MGLTQHVRDDRVRGVNRQLTRYWILVTGQLVILVLGDGRSLDPPREIRKFVADDFRAQERQLVP